MFDITDPFLTNQARKDLLETSNNPEHLAEKVLAQEKGKAFGSGSYWKVTRDQLIEMNEWSIDNDLQFNFYTEMLEKLNPNYDILLMEHDRIQKGEWDNFSNRFSPHSYTNVCVIALNGRLVGELPTGLADDPDEEPLPLALEKEYPYGEYSANDTHMKAGRLMWSLGIADYPNHLLLEEDRTIKRTYIFSDTWARGFDNAFGKQMRKFAQDNPDLMKKYKVKGKKGKKGKKNKKVKGFGDER